MFLSLFDTGYGVGLLSIIYGTIDNGDTLSKCCKYSSERDVNNEVLWVWSYPGVDGGMRDLLMKKCSLDQNEEDSKEALVPPFSFGHMSRVWYYLSNFQAAEAETLPKVGNMSLSVVRGYFLFYVFECM